MMRSALCVLLLLGLSALSFAQAPGPGATEIDGITMVALRPVSDWLGTVMTVDEKAQTILLEKEKSTLHISWKGTEATLNDKALTLEVKPINMDGVLFVPVSLIHEVYGVEATWNQAKTVLTLRHPNNANPLVLTTRWQDPNMPDMQPIFEAIQKGDLERVKQLVKEDPRVVNQVSNDDGGDKEGMTPLFTSMATDHDDIAKFLIDNGADLKATVSPMKLTVLAYRGTHGSEEIVELLVAKGLDINIKMESGMTPLHMACSRRWLQNHTRGSWTRKPERRWSGCWRMARRSMPWVISLLLTRWV